MPFNFKMLMLKKIVLLLLLTSFLPTQAEEGTAQDIFLQQAFLEEMPKAQLLWLKKDLKTAVEKILQHKAGFLRTRYWQQDAKSVWILEEVGKTQPITVGVIIEDAKISKIQVLAFRESRGWEVKHDFFTNQFKQLELNDKSRLSKNIDGISGATLSVRALTKIAQLALLFDQSINEKK